jgi:hypothetical protein
MAERAGLRRASGRRTEGDPLARRRRYLLLTKEARTSKRAAGRNSTGWRDALPLLTVLSCLFGGFLAGWYCAILAQSFPLNPWLGGSVAALFALMAWRLERRPRVRAVAVGAALASAAGWVLMVLAAMSPASF